MSVSPTTYKYYSAKSATNSAFDQIFDAVVAIQGELAQSEPQTVDDLVVSTGIEKAVILSAVRVMEQRREIVVETAQSTQYLVLHETAVSEFTNSKLSTVYTDLVNHEGSTTLEIAQRLYPAIPESLAEAIVKRQIRCLLYARALVQVP